MNAYERLMMSGVSPHAGETVIFGSSFDPPHWGHSLIIHALLRSPGVTAVWIMVSPPRWDKVPKVSLCLRERWVNALITRMNQGLDSRRQGLKIDPNVTLSVNARAELRGDERELQGTSPIARGTGVLLEYLALAHPERRFALAVGTDIYPDIGRTWRDGATGRLNGKELLERFPIWLVPRAASPAQTEAAAVVSKANDLAMTPRCIAPLASWCSDFAAFHGILPEQTHLSSSELRGMLNRHKTLPPGTFLFPEMEPEIAAAYA